MHIRTHWLCLAIFLAAPAAFAQNQAKPRFESPVITSRTPGHAVEVDIDVAGAKQLYLVVTDGGDGYGCDWADWAEPRLVGPAGEKILTELKWKSAHTQWGQVRVDRNCGGGPLRIAGKEVSYGIGTHANSLIVFDLPDGVTRFKARAGLDNGGTDQNGGGVTSVKFLIYAETPPQHILQIAQGGGDGGSPADREPDSAVEQLDVHEQLEATLFASEPMVQSLTNLDVDHRGRIWVCEVVNYRGHNGRRPEGDRILILEDTTGDGRADSVKVFYQGRDIDSAMGICVLGNRVIVSASPHIFVFTDEDGDDKPDKKELLFTNTGQPQHDHSAHSFVFGPDGKLYWNFGNTGRRVHDREGKLVVDQAGNEVTDNGRPYRQGMVFRCNLDGSEFEVLGHNFRNNYEVAVDSLGTLWQSDNDDDGNRGVRINYVMEFGNFGYTDELTGAGWNRQRTNVEAEIPRRHWHENDPGVVPNLLVTGAGSPTGITVYEGRLLPKVFWNQVIHCDAGPSVVRAYPVAQQGAGYSAETVNVLHGARNNWFRPADVCVAPDGSLFVTDWHDPGVGGHAARELTRGRLFRVAPPKHKYERPKFDFESVAGAVAALQNPNQSVRYLAHWALVKLGSRAEPALVKLYRESDDSRFRARAAWLLGKLAETGRGHVLAALADKDPDLRVVGLRLARQVDSVDPIEAIERLLATEQHPHVLRECAIALRHNPSPEAPRLWAELAARHDGNDRWYLEALGIAADRQWNAFLEAWLQRAGEKWNTPAGRDIVWRSRAAATPGYLARIIADRDVPAQQLPRYFRAFDFQARGPEHDGALLQLVFAEAPADAARRDLIAAESISRLQGFNLGDRRSVEALDRVLDRISGSSQFVELVGRFNVERRYPEVLALAQSNPGGQIGVEAIRLLLAKDQLELIRRGLDDGNAEVAAATAQVLGNAVDNRSVELLLALVVDAKRPVEQRQQAAKGLAKTRSGATRLVALIEGDALEESVRLAPAFELNAAPWDEIRAQAAKLFPPPPSKTGQPLPPLQQLVATRGDAERGKVVFFGSGTCGKCHVVGGEGTEVGPNLSGIGTKLSREALVESILFPSAGISHNYETYAVALADGNVVTGVLVSRTPQALTIKSVDAIARTFEADEIDDVRKLPLSLMPADLQKEMTVQELVDVVEYMTRQRDAAAPAAGGSR